MGRIVHNANNILLDGGTSMRKLHILDALLRILANCDERTLNTIKIIAKDLADNQTNK